VRGCPRNLTSRVVIDPPSVARRGRTVLRSREREARGAGLATIERQLKLRAGRLFELILATVELLLR